MLTAMPTLFLVRHGQASYGAIDYDVLSESGHEQAAALARELRERGQRIDRVVSGSLRRQQETALPIAAEAGVDVEFDPRWDEYSDDDILSHHSSSDARTHGTEGSSPALTSREFQGVLETALVQWLTAGEDAPTTESYAAFAGRSFAALAELATDLPAGGAAVACTSSGVLAAICVSLMETRPEAFVAFNRVAVNAGITKVVVGRRGMTLISFNEHGHLERDDRRLVTYR